MSRKVRKSLIGVVAGLVLFYVLDYVYARAQKNPFSDIPVDRMFAMENRWGGLEYSVGKSGYERCVHSAFPHFGYVPCWYLMTQEIRYIHVG